MATSRASLYKRTGTALQPQIARRRRHESTSMAATMKLSLTFVLLLSALVVFGEAQATCDNIRCIQGGYITCKNYPGQKLNGCACVCAPEDGKGCVLHLDSGSTNKCTKY